MDMLKNPFAPGAGNMPPELAGRDAIVRDASTDIKRLMRGHTAKPQVFVGVRGVGKTVLLNRMLIMAKEERAFASSIEATDRGTFIKRLAVEIRQVLQEVSFNERAKELALRATEAMFRFAEHFKIEIGGAMIAVKPSQRIPIIGDLAMDLGRLFEEIGMALRRADRAWVLLIDEMQHLSEDEATALLEALHKVSQLGLPIVVHFAGLQSGARALCGTKSYAERLVSRTDIEFLDLAATRDAIRKPLLGMGESIEDAALDRIFRQTNGYPYFVQSFASAAWQVAEASPISLHDVERSIPVATDDLDRRFFALRMDRLTGAESRFLVAMASLGDGPCSVDDIARKMDSTAKKISGLRDRNIKKGMIISPARGMLEFTAPMFADYLMRRHIG